MSGLGYVRITKIQYGQSITLAASTFNTSADTE